MKNAQIYKGYKFEVIQNNNGTFDCKIYAESQPNEFEMVYNSDCEFDTEQEAIEDAQSEIDQYGLDF